MEILASARSAAEATELLQLDIDILDLKNPDEGSLGALPPWELSSIRRSVQWPIGFPTSTNSNGSTRKMPEVSIALGDLHYQPGTISLACAGVVGYEPDYIKLGMFKMGDPTEAVTVLRSAVRVVNESDHTSRIVAAGYGDWRRVESLPPWDLLAAAVAAEVPVVLLDTAGKTGQSLFDFMDMSELKGFVEQAHEVGLRVALAGALGESHLGTVSELGCDIIGVRGALCEGGNRKAGIDVERAGAFVQTVKSL